jgi:hypothetical protein
MIKYFISISENKIIKKKNLHKPLFIIRVLGILYCFNTFKKKKSKIIKIKNILIYQNVF